MGAGSIRSLLFRLHKWVGMQLLILFAILFASGTLLVVSDELVALAHPGIWAAAPADGGAASFGQIYDSVTAEFPSGIVYVEQRQPQPWLGDRTYLTTGWGEKVIVWTDPATAAVLEVTPDRDFRAILRDLHDSLLVPGTKPGRLAFILVSATGLIMAYSVISGLIAYRRFWKGFFRMPTRSLGLRGYQGGLHRLLGLWLSVFLLIISISAGYFMITGLGFTGGEPGFRPPVQRAQARPQGFDGDAIDRAENAALDALPGLDPVVIVLPSRANTGLEFIGPEKGYGAITGPSAVSIDPVTMAPLGIVQPDMRTGTRRFKSAVDALHFGQWGGVYGRALWVLFGVLGLWLMLSGARVNIARTAHLPGAPENLGAIRRFARSLGIFKWANLALIVAVAGLLVVNFGPWSQKPAWIAATAGSAPAVAARISKPLRAGQPARLSVFIKENAAESVSITSGDDPTEVAALAPAAQGGRLDFSIPATRDANRFDVILHKSDGTTQKVVYDLGAAIW